MVTRDPKPRTGAERVPGWVKAGAILAFGASAFSACGPSSADKAPTPAPTTSSADRTPGATPTASATETTKDAFPASPDSITQGEVFSKLTHEQRAIVSRIDGYTNLADADKESAENRALYATVFLETYRKSVTDNLKETHTGQAGTLYGLANAVPAGDTNTAKQVLDQLTLNNAILYGSLAPDGDDSTIDNTRRLAATKAAGGLFTNPTDPLCVKLRAIISTTTEIKNAPGNFGTDGYIPYGALDTSTSVTKDPATGKSTIRADKVNTLNKTADTHTYVLVSPGNGIQVWQQEESASIPYPL